MDPLSITASVIAILQLTTSIITTTKDFYRGTKNVPKEVGELLEELASFSGVLESLNSIIKKADETNRGKNVAGDPVCLW